MYEPCIVLYCLYKISDKHQFFYENCEILYYLFLHTSPIEPMLKNVIYQTIIHSLKAGGKHEQADVIYYCKMTSVIALEGVTSFLRL